MNKSFYDAPQAALSFLMQQGAHVESEVYRIEYPQYKYTDLVPLDSSAPDWSKTVIFNSVDSRGELQLLGPNSTDVPTVDIAMSQGFHEIKTAALGYTYSLEELEFARLNGTSLDTERAIAVRDVVEQGMNKIYLMGDKGVGEGLYTSPNVPVAVADNSVIEAVASTNTNGPQAVIDIFAQAYNAIYVSQTRTVHRPNTFVMPTSVYRALATAIFGNNNASNVSMLTYLQNNFGDITFEEDILLENAGVGGTRRLVAYKRDIRVVKGHDVMPLRFLPPATADSVNFRVPALARTGGTEVRVPSAMYYLDGI